MRASNSQRRLAPPNHCHYHSLHSPLSLRSALRTAITLQSTITMKKTHLTLLLAAWIALPTLAQTTETTTPPTALGASLQSDMQKLDDKHPLGPGDRVSYRVIEDKDPTTPLIVTDAGEIEVPYYGRVTVAGKTCLEAAKEIKQQLEKDLYYQATVILAVDQLNRKRGIVYVTGNVGRQGPLDIPSDEKFTVSKAIMQAGGFADFANPKKVRVTREASGPEGRPQTFEINVQDVIDNGRIDKDLVLEPGDMVVVPSRAFSF